MINAQKTAYSKENPKVVQIDENDEHYHYETPQTFVQQLLGLYSKGLITDQNMRDNVFLIIAAGSDTSALTLSFCILLLAMHPDIQADAAAEVDQVFADLAPNEDLNYKHINKLEFLEQILKETLRLNPVFPFIPRICTEDTKIRDDLTIPAESAVVVNLLTMHRRKG